MILFICGKIVKKEVLDFYVYIIFGIGNELDIIYLD